MWPTKFPVTLLTRCLFLSYNWTLFDIRHCHPHQVLVYEPFDFITTNCTPENRGWRVVFLSLSLDFMHLFLISCLLTCLFDVSIVLVWKKWVKSDKLSRSNIRLSKMYVHTGGAFTAKLSKLLRGLQGCKDSVDKGKIWRTVHIHKQCSTLSVYKKEGQWIEHNKN